jgi:hypothetical protein
MTGATGRENCGLADGVLGQVGCPVCVIYSCILFFFFSFNLSDTDCNSVVGLWVQQASVIPLVSLAYSIPFLGSLFGLVWACKLSEMVEVGVKREYVQ